MGVVCGGNVNVHYRQVKGYVCVAVQVKVTKCGVCSVWYVLRGRQGVCVCAGWCGGGGVANACAVQPNGVCVCAGVWHVWCGRCGRRGAAWQNQPSQLFTIIKTHANAIR